MARDGDSPPAEPGRVDLQWKARRQDGAYGFQIYRADRRAGPFLLAEPHIIPAVQPSADATASYSWSDRQVVCGETYFYYVDTVSLEGLKGRFSGTLERTVACD